MRAGICRFISGMKKQPAIHPAWLIHLLVWLVVGSVWYYLRYQDYAFAGTAVRVTIIKTIDLALMVYLANYVLIPGLLYRKKYLLFTLAFIGMIVCSSIYKMYLIGKLTHTPGLLNWSGNIKARIYDNVIPHIFLVIAGVAIKLLFDFTRMQQRLAEVAREKAVAELNFLKSQINPHFLFNSLNAVYFLIDKGNTDARRALHKFSEMLRYQLYEAGGEKIPIEKEISYLRDYISLQQLRNDKCLVDLSIDEHMSSFLIEPLLLVPFVENSFKHLSHYSNGKPNEVRIGLAKHRELMELRVENTTEALKEKEVMECGGIGLANVRRRLELLYPRQHQLDIVEADGWFRVHLTIQMQSI